MNSRESTALSWILIFIYLVFALLFFMFVAEPSLKGETSLRVGADSLTYIRTARYFVDRPVKFTDVVSLSSNLFGPVLLLLLFKFNYFAIFIFNSILFIICIKLTLVIFPSNSTIITLFIILNPITLLSITTINKEIMGMAGIMFIIYYFKNKKFRYLLFAMVLSFAARWQQLLFVLLCLPYFKIIFSRYHLYRYAPLLILIVASIAYPFADPYVGFTGSDQLETARSQFQQAGGFLLTLNTLQKTFLYVIVFVPKVFLSLIGNLGRLTDLTESNTWNDLYNSLLYFHQILMLILLYILTVRRRLNLKSELTQFIVLYLVIYCTSLFISYRYFYPLYIPIAALALSSARSTRSMPSRKTEDYDHSLYGNL